MQVVPIFFIIIESLSIMVCAFLIFNSLLSNPQIVEAYKLCIGILYIAKRIGWILLHRLFSCINALGPTKGAFSLFNPTENHKKQICMLAHKKGRAMTFPISLNYFLLI